MSDDTHIAGGFGATSGPSGTDSLPDRVGLAPGDLVSNTYRITREVARGGMGALYEGTHDITGARVAIKAVLEEMAGDPKAVRLFEREALALSKVKHEAIVGYRDILRDHKDRLFIIMDFVDGPPLSKFVGQAHLPADGVLTLGRRLADGLAAAHAADVTHRDISPKNIILPGEDISQAVIIDFGIAKHMAEDGNTVIGDNFAGTLSHAAPEQLGLFSGKVDQRADIYALGIVLAQVAGVKFNLGQGLADAVLARQHDLTLPDDIDPRLKAMLVPMLRANPNGRPGNMREAVLEKDLSLPVDEPGSHDDVAAGSGPDDTHQNQTIDRIRDGSETTGRNEHTGAGTKKKVVAGVAGAAVAAALGTGVYFQDEILPLITGGPEVHMSFDQAKAIVDDTSSSAAEKIAAAQALVASGQTPGLDVAFGVYRALARDGNADAAMLFAEMYDPAFYSPTTSPLRAANPTQAIRWYRVAVDGGRTEAADRIQRLESQ